MDSTLRFFSKTNSSSWLRIFFISHPRWLFKVGCRVFYIKQLKCHLDQDLRENRRFRWKNENLCLKNFFGVPGQKLALREVEQSQGFPKVKHSKYKNGFFTISSLDLKISRTIFSFQSDEHKPRYLDLKILASKLKGHSRSAKKSLNGFSLSSSLCLI